jgi:hypothetical protein
MLLQEVAPLDALAAAARGVSLEAGERVQRRLGGLAFVVAFRRFIRRGGRRLVGRARVVVIRAGTLLKRVGHSCILRGGRHGQAPVAEAEAQGEDEGRAPQRRTA